MNAYVKRVYDGLCARNSHEKEFLQAAEEMRSLHRRTTLGSILRSHRKRLRR